MQNKPHRIFYHIICIMNVYLFNLNISSRRERQKDTIYVLCHILRTRIRT